MGLKDETDVEVVGCGEEAGRDRSRRGGAKWGLNAARWFVEALLQEE